MLGEVKEATRQRRRCGRRGRAASRSPALVVASCLTLLVVAPLTGVATVTTGGTGGGGGRTTTLLFSDTFAGDKLGSQWTTFITSRASGGQPWWEDGAGGSGEGCQFDEEYFEPGDVRVDNGLSLEAVRQPTEGECNGLGHVFAWESGVVTTYGHFEFDGGYVDVDMEAPAGAGMWPAIWMLPGPGCSCTTDNFEVDVQEGGFLSAHASPGQTYAWHLHDNVAGRTVGGVVTTGQDLAAGFHHYGLLWVPGRALTWYFDGRQVAAVTRSTLPVPDEPMELVLSLGVAGTATSSWHSVTSQRTPSPAVMRVVSVSVFRTGPPPGGRH